MGAYSLPEHMGKNVEVLFRKKEEGFSIKIIDSGNGFEWKNYLHVDPSRALDSHGRGIAQANYISFDRLAYNDMGNEVTCFVNKEETLEW
jgi:hypothetical protein